MNIIPDDDIGAIQTLQSDEIIWLPTQSQLQEMVRTVYLYELINQFNNWFDDQVLIEGLAKFDNASMEQLWLAFVMKELYQKIWSKEKEKWICE